MQNTLDQFVDGWQAMDAAAIGEALSSPAAFAPMEIGGLFDAIIGAGAVAAEVAGLYAYSELVRDVRTALANRDIETINRLVQVAAVIGQWTAPTIAAAGPVIAANTRSIWAEYVAPGTEPDAEIIEADLAGEGWTWNGTSWARA